MERLGVDRLAQLSGPSVASDPAIGFAGGAVEPTILSEVVAVEATRPERPAGLLGARWWQLAVKRTIDLLGATAMILVLSPILIVSAAAVAFTSPGPILYRQRRVGRDGEPFTMLKFRSMYDRAHEQRDLHLNEATGPVFKIRDDPRVTGVGRVLRRLSIDELPQLFNVVKGEMSLVGPRPALPEECVHYTEREMGRLMVKPGLTCRWQVSGRSDVTFEQWVDMDLEYIDTWSLRQDVVLMLKTVPAVISGRGAY
ncbi:MAG TPA: sugar transferase [Actinomycetota bacterium]|jgi:lipopolysaccharide/colanic/teichoic acid biosynthesis glycosyltransferase